MKKAKFKPAKPDYKGEIKQEVGTAIENFENDLWLALGVCDNLPESVNEEIEKLLKALKAETNNAINESSIDATELVKDAELMDEVVDAMRWHYSPKDDAFYGLVGMMETNGYYVIEARSLAEQMKVEAFQNELIENPYQLSLI